MKEQSMRDTHMKTNTNISISIKNAPGGVAIIPKMFILLRKSSDSSVSISSPSSVPLSKSLPCAFNWQSDALLSRTAGGQDSADKGVGTKGTTVLFCMLFVLASPCVCVCCC